MQFLAMSPDDVPFAIAALSAAVQQRQDESIAELDYLAARIASQTTTGFANVMRGVVRAFRPRR